MLWQRLLSFSEFTSLIFLLFFFAGVEPTGNQVDAPAKFHVETFQAGQGNVEPIIINPRGQREKVSRVEFFVQKKDCHWMFSVMWSFVTIKIKHMIALTIQQWKDNIK